MTQHIIVVDVTEEGTTIVSPELASVWRDDQTIMWSVNPGFKWPDPLEGPVVPILFNEGWPGGPAIPIGDPPPSGVPDQRNYIALAGLVLPDGTLPQRYTYNIVALPIDKVVNTRSELVWTDPDVENQPRP